jgi:hypothetical protein
MDAADGGRGPAAGGGKRTAGRDRGHMGDGEDEDEERGPGGDDDDDDDDD